TAVSGPARHIRLHSPHASYAHFQVPVSMTAFHAGHLPADSSTSLVSRLLLCIVLPAQGKSGGAAYHSNVQSYLRWTDSILVLYPSSYPNTSGTCAGFHCCFSWCDLNYRST